MADYPINTYPTNVYIDESYIIPRESVKMYDKLHTFDPAMLINAQELIEDELKFIATCTYQETANMMQAYSYMIKQNLKDAQEYEGIHDAELQRRLDNGDNNFLATRYNIEAILYQVNTTLAAEYRTHYLKAREREHRNKR